jgi:hypothetical protein
MTVPTFIPAAWQPIPVNLGLPQAQQRWYESWPWRDYVELVAVDAAVPSARKRLRSILWDEWGISEVADDAELIVAELVANAVTATRAVQWKAKNPPVRLWTLGSGDAVTILVWDATPGVPRVGNPGGDEEQGRGLMIVRELADWGFYLAPEDYGGKVIWAQLPKA